MSFNAELENKQAIIRILGFLLFLLICVNGFFGYKLMETSEIKFIDIPSHTVAGSIDRMVPGVMQKTTVYDFTQRTFQSLQRWRYDGSIEYEKNIRSFEAVLTPSYKSFLRRDYKRRLGDEIRSELKGRTRMLNPLLSGWDDDRVQITATKEGKPTAWVVFLDMELLEYHLGQKVKTRFIRYPIRVALDASDRTKNPWLLALDGYESDPKTITKDLQVGKK